MADQLKMKTPNGVSENISWIAERFPSCVTETRDSATGKLKLSVDFDQLRQELSENVVEGHDERYQFVWPDKKKTILLANAPINATLRPCREESVDFDNTQNLYIEGDNLDVLKCLKETYMGKIKVIYIDPPYNTGNDFVYNDSFTETIDEYMNNSGQYDELGNKLVANLENNGRFHTDWLNMIYPRLKVARDLLKEDGVIFISIDDREDENLKKICNEIFGQQNFITQIVWQKKYSPQNDARYFSTMHDYILCYVKKKNLTDNDGGWIRRLLPRSEAQNNRYKNPDNDPRGPWKAADLTSKTKAAGHSYPITTPSGRVVLPAEGRQWAPALSTFEKLLSDNRIWFGADGNNVPSQKVFLSEVQDGQVPNTIWFREEVGDSQSALKELNSLMGYPSFDTPKPVELIKRILMLSSSDDDIVLDFFSGSATTAQACMRLNIEDKGNRKFIMIQVPEILDRKSPAYQQGLRTLCDIGKERIRKSGRFEKDLSIKNNTLFSNQSEQLDLGFRVLKLDSSNMLDVYYSPVDISQNQITLFQNNVKSDRNSEDLLFQVMLELGATLDSKIEKSVVTGKEIFNVADGYLVACFDDEVNDEAVKAIAKMQPQYAVLRDSSLANDSTATNFEQIFKTFSPSTTCKIL